MLLKFGFELEGFYFEVKEDEHGRKYKNITVPPTDYSTDGFPGLVEIRTAKPSTNIFEAYMNMIACYRDSIKNVDFSCHTHTFSKEDKAVIRTKYHVKEAVKIRNIYGKAPRLLGNKTIASFQINISNIVASRSSYVLHDGSELELSDQYGLFDFANIIRALDKAFEKEIKEARRQPGEYAIKGNRLEYRSLPNFVAPLTNMQDIYEFIDKLSKIINDNA